MTMTTLSAIYAGYEEQYFSQASPRGKQRIRISPSDFDAMTGPSSALMVGSAQEMIDKIMQEYELFHHDR